ncbi:MAG: flap endonuclease [Candidatus Eisenbacteria bacterium]|uniref:Flap endonuclease n=1 Tax=Eiseniibacteriota bacterium TaxID=2212470 RepID=A0A538T786_UNCEI|nr:MAG: flap endonuclease [Candidatus Eisenbacteria bacterium]
MRVHLVDGTYELFRHFYGGPPVTDASGKERGAVVGVIQTLLGMLEEGATHIGVATDHIIESFRNELYPGYKTGEGIDPLLREQFEPLETAIAALGVVVWPMVEVEADDALAAAAAAAVSDPRVEQVVICTPDKDLAQCVRGDRVVQLDRRAGEVRNADAVIAKFGVPPASIADYLALVGDSSDGFPGLPGWGPKAASAVLARYGRLEDIPASVTDWEVTPRGAAKLAGTLRERWNDAMLFRTLATLRTDQPAVTVDGLEYRGPASGFEALAASWGRPKLFIRAQTLAAGRRT